MSASEGLLFSTSSSYIAVVAIDFGTTYSRFAFTLNHKKGEGGILMNREWGHDQGTATLKTPNSLLLHPDGSFDSFGYEAEEKYANFFNGEDRDYLYFKHFKMALHKSETLDRNTKLTARNGKKIDALVVFAHSLRYLKDRAIKIIRDITGDEKYNEKDIRWVITVPAIWRPADKQFMREAACKAEMVSNKNPEQLLIALEPEAASVHCREMKMREFANEKGDATVSDVFARPGSKYLVIDIGVDLEVHLKGRRKFKSGSKVYFVERLISRRRLKNEDFEYLVKWKDWPLWTSTWEPSAKHQTFFDDSDWNELTVIQVLFFIIGAIWRL